LTYKAEWATKSIPKSSKRDRQAPPIGLASVDAAMALGVFLAAFMASLDIAAGRLLMRRNR
jgi:hypothetical protein